RWTPLYYDNIWKKWMTSLIIPVYVNDEFIGVTGTDFILQDILAMLPRQEGRHSMIFDSQGQILSSARRVLRTDPPMNIPLQADETSADSLSQYARQYAANPRQVMQAQALAPEKLI